MTAIFISHRSSDNAEADALRSWLVQQGHEQFFLDFDPADGIPAGVDWEQHLYQALRRCQALLIVLTPAWLESKWCGNELAIAREKGKAVFVVRVRECVGGPLIPAIQEVDLIADREAGLSKLARGLKEHGLDPASAFDWKPGRPIYPGLAAFDVDDAVIFFGRSEESWQAVEALRRLRLQAVGSPKLLLITGASGSGKSSLMRAGVLARLRKEQANWIVAKPFRRGGDALGALAEAIAWAFPPDQRPPNLAATTDRLSGQDGAAQLLMIARELRLSLDRPDSTLVLALDQAEELLTAERADDATKLLDLFRGTLARVGTEILVLASLRSDRLGTWQQHGSIRATAEHGELPFEMLPLGPMPMARIGEIVRGPAAYEGLRIDDDLVDAIRVDTPTADALPLLAYTLQYLHARFAADGRLSLDEYRSFGGLDGSVRSQADAAIPIECMSAEDRGALQEAFVPGLVRATTEGGFSRSRAVLATLPARAEPYLRRLVDDARLLATDCDPYGNVTVEVAHEALLRVWPTLARWIGADAVKLRRLEALQRAAADWTQNGRGEDFLIHRDHRLADVETLIAEPRFGLRLDLVDRDYLNTCREQQNLREAEEKAAQERELLTAQRLAKTRKRRLQWAGVVAVVLLIATEGLFWVQSRGLPLSVVMQRWRYVLGMKILVPSLVTITQGKFEMGSVLDEHEIPIHPVEITQPFEMGVNEITFKEWDACVADGGCNAYWPNGEWGRELQPVVNVSWHDAEAYLVWLSRKLGQVCRLPTEAEWEYACRAGTRAEFAIPAPNGSKDISDQGLANCDGCGSEWDNSRTAPAGQFPANAWGLHDMHGNAWEWIEDCFHQTYEAAPQDGRAWRGANKNCTGMVRGGSWSAPVSQARCAQRGYSDRGARGTTFGFRVVCSPLSSEANH